MGVLITGGGTKVRIDKVRNIGNEATGSFPSKLVLEYLKNKIPVTFLISDVGVKPFEVKLDLRSQDFEDVKDRVKLLKSLNKDLYTEKLYSTYDEYSDLLIEELYKSPEVIYLGAAVSDFGCVESTKSKIDSSNFDKMHLTLTPTKKLIGIVKEISPNSKLVGFKLLYDVPRLKLISAAAKSIEENKCDVVIANDYHKIKSGKPETILVSNDGVKVIPYSKFMAEEIVGEISEYLTLGYW